jgi:hypothetical protein
MKHTDIRHKLSEYIDDAVTPGERAAIEEHLATCTECADALRELRRTIEHIQGVEEIEPPAWMSGKIMAAVREDAERRRSLFRRLFFPLAVKIPLQTLVVLFVAVTAYYIYYQAHPVSKYAEAPLEQAARPTEPSDKLAGNRSVAEETAPRGKKEAPRAPGYKSLDMKYAYEQPAPPEREAADSSLMKKPAAGTTTAVQDFRGASRGAAPQAAAPAAAPARSNAKQEESVTAATRKEREQESAAQKTIIEYFMKHDLPDRMKTRGLTVTSSQVPDGWPELNRLDEAGRKRIQLCRMPYLINVRLQQEEQRYFYCLDGRIVILLRKYELSGETWIERK